MVKIGEVARALGISVQTVRLYEAEGVLIGFRSRGGTRWFSGQDIGWIRTIRTLLAEGLNFEGIRRLLAQAPCWTLRPCGPDTQAQCRMSFEHRIPCWIAPDRLCTETRQGCYHCVVYRQAEQLLNLKSLSRVRPQSPGGTEP